MGQEVAQVLCHSEGWQDSARTSDGMICMRWLTPVSNGTDRVLGAKLAFSFMPPETTSFTAMLRARANFFWLMVVMSSSPYTSSSAALPAASARFLVIMYLTNLALLRRYDLQENLPGRLTHVYIYTNAEGV